MSTAVDPLVSAPVLNPEDATMLTHFVTVLDNTLSANGNARSAAATLLQTLLAQVDRQQGYPQTLLTIAAAPHLDKSITSVAATALKNVIKKCWDNTKAEHAVQEADKVVVRARIFQDMLAAPTDGVRRQHAESIALIANTDFPREWRGILEAVVGVLAMVPQGITPANSDTALSAMKVARSLLQRYRTQFDDMTPEVVRTVTEELTFINAALTKPLVEAMEYSSQLLKTSAAANDVNAAKVAVQLLCVATEIFFDVTFLDMGKEHEQLLPRFMTVFIDSLRLDFQPLLGSGESSGPLLDLQSQVMAVVARFLEQHDEEFEPFVGAFTEVVWGLFRGASAMKPHADDLIINAMGFIGAACIGMNAKLLDNPEQLRQLCHDVILPNMLLTETDLEFFEYESENYIARDVEGSDLHTRRRAATDLVRRLMEKFSDKVTGMFQEQIAGLLAQQTWHGKNAAIYLVTALAIRGTVSSNLGAGALTNVVSIGEFFQTHIAPELHNLDVPLPAPNDTTLQHPVVKADAIRFVATFRHHIPVDAYPHLLHALAVGLGAKSVVVHTYAAHAVDRLLSVEDNNVRRVTPAIFNPVAGALLGNLCRRMSLDRMPNVYTAQSLSRLVSTFPDSAKPFAGDVVQALTPVLSAAVKNPSNPVFTHYLFEILAAATKAVPEHAEAIEGLLWPALTQALTEDVVELVPYVFQLLGVLLDARGSGAPIPEYFMQLYAPLLLPATCERPANVPAVCRLLGAFIRCGSPQLHATGLTEKTLGVYQMLVTRKQYDHFGLELITTLVAHYPREVLDPLMPTVFGVIFQRMTAAKTSKFMKCVTLFVTVLVVLRGVEYVESVLERVQAGIFTMTLEKIVLQACTKVSGDMERKVCAVALAQLATQSKVLQQPQHAGTLADCVLKGLSVLHFGVEQDAEAAHYMVKNATVDDLRVAELDSLGSTFCPLQAAERTLDDPCAAIPDAKLFFRETVAGFARATPGFLSLLQQHLPPDALGALLS